MTSFMELMRCVVTGQAVVLLDKAALWTDGRYFLQGEAELDCNWILMKQGERTTLNS